MEIDEHKVDEISLALLYLTTFKDKWGFQAWKSYSWDVLDRLHESGYIDDLRSKVKSVLLTDEDLMRSRDSVRETFREIVIRTRTARRSDSHYSMGYLSVIACLRHLWRVPPRSVLTRTSRGNYECGALTPAQLVKIPFAWKLV
jgi:hypothetical protein